MSIWIKILGDPSKKQIKKINPFLVKIGAYEKLLQDLSDESLRAKTQEFKDRISRYLTIDEKRKDELEEQFGDSSKDSQKTNLYKKQQKILQEILPEAYALVREASRRVLLMRHFDVQMIGGIILHQGKIAEMKTGEGKTLVSTLPIYLNALLGRGVHVVTVNDYLAKRDAEWMGRIFDFLGLSVGVIVHDHSFLINFDQERKKIEETSDQQIEVESQNLQETSRRQAYLADITYGTNNEFGFDYLRDNMAPDIAAKVQRDLYYAVIDEVDSILVDEARTPLIISAPAEESGDLYRKFAGLIPTLLENTDYNVDEKLRAVSLTDEGIKKMENLLGMDNLYDKGVELAHHLEQALKAHVLFKKDRDYVIKDGEIIIVDEFTGRLMFGRRYSEGLHQAIEAKENVEIKKESVTLATITFQNYFRLYDKLAGMTGTAMTESEEFFSIYKLDVVEIPTNKKTVRKDSGDKIFKNETGKFKALVEEIKKRNEIGQPVLVGTISIEKNELLSHLLKINGVPHEVLNAKQHEREATIIAQAGAKGAVTIATNMAGRGVDIILGGHPYDEGKANEVRDLGGLCVFGTERHESRRIDNQLRGRSGRQGDPGFSQFFISMEDDLMRIFGAERIKKMMDTLGIPDDQPIENKIVSSAIETAQKKVEGHNFDIRKHVLEYDDVMNRQRAAIYSRRDAILKGQDDLSGQSVELQEKAKFVIQKEVVDIIHRNSIGDRESWNTKEIVETLNAIFSPLPLGLEQKDLDSSRDGFEMEQKLAPITDQRFSQKIEEFGEETKGVLRYLFLRIIDMFWVQHLTEMNHLRTSIGLVGYGQKNPLVEYKHRSYNMFQQLQSLVDSNFAKMFFKIQIEKSQNTNHKTQTNSSNQNNQKEENNQDNTVGKMDKKNIGRNDPCPCGSGKKYKKCHGG
ncbi:preprotein translocase subunit SecA [Candidatus Microgenomates bacterium]|nr:preprotein translocase subunit SecA [Candidatus Microgenomates bacterium]